MERGALNFKFGIRNSECGIICKTQICIKTAKPTKLVKLSTACEGSRGREAPLSLSAESETP